mmetsp:Transcript_143546/g.357721  ORF Transcript_143546/g.357721 Transcript_143546/m.357721 type:complete len:249 (+) Transcript_143546:82-828(+)
MSGTRDENIFMARLAEQAERYDDMCEYMKRAAMMGIELDLEERNLLSVAFKNSLGSVRQAWRVTVSDEQRLPHAAQWIRDYRARLEAELDSKCTEILAALDTHLIPKTTDDEAKVFFMKMKGDYHRYHAEFQNEGGRAEAAGKAQAAYKDALAQAETLLGPAHPMRLGLALNYSVFFNEVLGQTQEAVQLARGTLEAATGALEGLDPERQRESAQIMQLLSDNLQLWTSAAAADGKAPELDGTAVEDL